MDSNRAIYPIKYEWGNDALYRVWSNGFYELWMYIPAGTNGVFTYPIPFTGNPVEFVSFMSSRGDRSFDRELCLYNISPTSCSFSNFTVPNFGGQGGFLYLCGNKAS